MSYETTESISLAEYHYNLVEILIKQQRWQEVIETCYKVLKLDPAFLPAYKTLGELLSKQEDWQGAVNCYQKALKLKPNSAELYHSLGWNLNQLDRWEEAAEALGKATRLNSEFSWSHNSLGEALMNLEKWEEAAVAFCKAIELNPDFPWSHYNLGDVLVAQGEIDQAIKAYQSALKLQADLPKLRQKLGQVLQQRSKLDSEAALECYLTAIEENPTDLDHYHKALSIQPESVELYCKLADRLKEQEQFQEAIVFYQLALQLKPDDQSILAKLEEVNNHRKYIEFKASVNKLVIPRSDKPKVSIVIPVYNKVDYTFRCLQSIAKHVQPTTAIEVLVMNDCSTDETEELLSQVKGLILVNNTENLGFLHNCNKGVSLAKGEYIYYLNNDTEIKPNCIESLLEVFANNEGVGAVGSKLMYPIGALQEAGGIVWNDSSGWNYGRMENPYDPKYNYLRPVDYCSAASLLVKKETLELLGGGFDPDFAPAYYEDTDLCFAIRNQLGLKVMYQPQSEVIHYEGISCGTDTGSGIKRYQVINAEKFQRKWEKALTNHHDNRGAEGILRASRRHAGDRTVLVIDAYLPYYDKESGSRRLFQLLQMFKQLNYHVIFVPNNGAFEKPYTLELENLQIEVLYTRDGYGKVVEEQIQERLPIIDFAWICRPELNQKYAPIMRQQPNIKVIYDTIDLHYLRMQRAWELSPQPRSMEKAREWLTMQQIELQMAREADLTITVTGTEKEILEQQEVENVAVIPNIHHPYRGDKPSFQERSGLLFIGGYNHPPNIGAVIWLCQEIMPIVWQKLPDLKVTLLGSNPPEKVKQLANDPRVSVPGFIHDVSPYFLSHRVFVAPLKYGAGMKGKIGQSLEFGLPIVSTAIGTEGMNLVPEKDALEANNTQDFVEAILRLYQDEKLWDEIANNSLQAISAYFPENVKGQLNELMNQLGG